MIPALILAATATPLSAQTAPPVEQAEALPDLAVPADKLGDERKYIVFHKPGVTVEQARADLSFCWRFLPHGVSRQAPGFVPWRKADANRPASYDGGPYGLVDMAIGAIIAGPLERSIRQSRLYRCMVPLGLGGSLRAHPPRAGEVRGPIPYRGGIRERSGMPPTSVVTDLHGRCRAPPRNYRDACE